MKIMNNNYEGDDTRPQNMSSRGKTNRLFSEIMGGNMLSKDGFVSFFPFVLYVVFLSMLYITNVYIAEDVNRDIDRNNRKVEDLYVEYVYLKSEITKKTKQSTLASVLAGKGIKESVETPKKIVVVKEGGNDD